MALSHAFAIMHAHKSPIATPWQIFFFDDWDYVGEENGGDSDADVGEGDTTDTFQRRLLPLVHEVFDSLEEIII